uniref:Uncharacterized protein n=1 Tax=Anguilla anguilla TaxID=7936 RepID=A0A0E9SCU7_ANGAN
MKRLLKGLRIETVLVNRNGSEFHRRVMCVLAA